MHLCSDLYQELLEKIVVVLPVTADELSVKQGHQCLRLIHIDGQCLLVVLKSFIELPFELEHVSEAAHTTGTFRIQFDSSRVLDECLLDQLVVFENVSLELVRSCVVWIHLYDFLANLEAVVKTAFSFFQKSEKNPVLHYILR